MDLIWIFRVVSDQFFAAIASIHPLGDVIRPEEFLPADFPVLKVNCLSALPSWLCLIVYLVIIRFRPN